jgi:N-acetylneuraminic acid mutarotase
MRCIGISLALLVLAGAGLAQPASAQSVEGMWTLKAPMPAPRGETAAVAFGGKLYVMGGSVLSVGAPFAKAVPRNEAYDPATDSWRVLAPMPVGRDHLGLAVVNGKIYSFGGFTYSTHQGAGSEVFEYDPAADKWRTLTPLKAPRASTGAAVIGGKIHVIGGRGDPMTTVTTHAVYDPATDAWTEAAPLPKARDHMVVIEAEGKIHAVGGRLGASTDRTDQHDVYDPAADTWSSAPPLKTPRSGLAGALYHGMILVLGGELAPNTFVENEGYDLKTKSWVTLAPMPGGRHGFGGGVIGNNAYFAGGSLKPGSGGITDQLIMFTLP